MPKGKYNIPTRKEVEGYQRQRSVKKAHKAEIARHADVKTRANRARQQYTGPTQEARRKIGTGGKREEGSPKPTHVESWKGKFYFKEKPNTNMAIARGIDTKVRRDFKRRGINPTPMERLAAGKAMARKKYDKKNKGKEQSRPTKKKKPQQSRGMIRRTLT